MMNQNRDAGRNASAFILIGLGVMFLIAQILNFSFFGTLWPLLVMLPGLAFLYFAFNGDKSASGLAVPGAIITGTGAILFYQNITDHWASWAYVWTLYPVFVGMALTYIGQRNHQENTYKAGQGLVRGGMMALAGFWVFFELIVFNGNSFFGNALLPAILIGGGIWLLFRRDGQPMKRKTSDDYVPQKVKRTNGYHPTPSEDLRAKIDAALAEPDEPADPREPNQN